MFQMLLYAFLAWFLYNLIFRFIIPIYKTTKQVKQKFREMHDQANNQAGQQQGFNQPKTANPKASSAKPPGDYIDFEEIK